MAVKYIVQKDTPSHTNTQRLVACLVFMYHQCLMKVLYLQNANLTHQLRKSVFLLIHLCEFIQHFSA